MPQISSRYCPACDRQRSAEWSGPNNVLHLVLTLFTAGFWLWVWLALLLFTGKWTCRECGTVCNAASRPTFIGTVARVAFWTFAIAFFAGLAALAWKMNRG